MRLVVFGLSVSSSWGNGHATLWRGLVRALGALGHEVVFFEKDAPWYASHRDLSVLPGLELVVYDELGGILPRATRALAACDAAMVTSFCPDGAAAGELVLASPAPVRVFYDLDTPVTLGRLERGEPIEWIGRGGLAGYDLVLSFTGGRALDELRARLGARRAAPLYGSVDPEVHRPVPPRPELACDLGHLGTYAADRRAALERLLLGPARRAPGASFLVAGPMYPGELAWPPNVRHLEHVAPADHAAFYGSSRATLNVTREVMARLGWCPSGRLFEAAACGVPIVSDDFEGLGTFFTPGEELLVAHDEDDVLRALAMPPAELVRIGANARARALRDHTAAARALELLELLETPRAAAVGAAVAVAQGGLP